MLKNVGKLYFEEQIKHKTHKNKLKMHKFVKRLNSLLNKCEKVSNDKRNHLAHHLIDRGGKEFVLTQPVISQRIKTIPPKTAGDLLLIQAEFLDLAIEIYQFNESMYKSLRPKEQHE